MSAEVVPLSQRRRKSSFGWFITLLILGGAGYGAYQNQDALRQYYQDYTKEAEKKPVIGLIHTVSKGDLTVTVRERGSIGADKEITIRSELTGQAQIIFIVPEGSNVKKDDLLVELDSSDLTEKITQQEITLQTAQANLTEADENVRIQEQQNETDVEAGQVKVEIAEADLLKYEEGDFPQSLRNAKSDITIAEEELERAKDRLKWTQKLQVEGFATGTELQADELSVKKAELAVEKAVATHRILEVYDQPKTMKEKSSKVKESKSALLQIKQKGRAQLLQKQALLDAKKATLVLQQDKLETYKDQLTKCKIYAPAPGLVVYYKTRSRYSSSTPIEEGAMVRERQDLITLPDISIMRVDVKVHESAIDMVRAGQKARVSIDAISGEYYRGTVTKVAPLPDNQVSWLNPDLKVYTTQVVINEDLKGMRPGLSAMAEIVVAEKKDVIRVPVQAVGAFDGVECCYVLKGDDDVEVRAIDVGLANEEYVEVSGVEAGERILLAPPASVARLVKVGFEEMKAMKAAERAKARAQRMVRKQPPAGVARPSSEGGKSWQSGGKRPEGRKKGKSGKSGGPS